jgi:hypothetical protein
MKKSDGRWVSTHEIHGRNSAELPHVYVKDE